jgi:hypothetical protein
MSASPAGLRRAWSPAAGAAPTSTFVTTGVLVFSVAGAAQITAISVAKDRPAH